MGYLQRVKNQTKMGERKVLNVSPSSFKKMIDFVTEILSSGFGELQIAQTKSEQEQTIRGEVDDTIYNAMHDMR